jgi:oxygen-independent coproporphyrinogen III oxidase
MLSVAELKELLNWIAECTQGVQELSIELHPALLSCELFDCLKAGGVNRISFGIQALDPDILGQHTRVDLHYGELTEYIRYAREIGIHHINFDFIYDLIGDSLAHIKAIGDYISEQRPTSVNYYPLRILTPHIEEQYVMSNKRRLAYYLAVKNLFADLGYTRKNSTIYIDPEQTWVVNFLYEDTIYAREHELYGLGVAATSHIGESFCKNTIDLAAYRQRVESKISPIELEFALSSPIRVAHDLYYYLLMYPDSPRETVVARFSAKWLPLVEQYLTNLADSGLIKSSPGRVTLTEKGYFYTEQIEEFLMRERPDELTLLRKL